MDNATHPSKSCCNISKKALRHSHDATLCRCDNSKSPKLQSLIKFSDGDVFKKIAEIVLAIFLCFGIPALILQILMAYSFRITDEKREVSHFIFVVKFVYMASSKY